MTQETYDKLIEAIWNVKSLQQIAATKRTAPEEHLFKTDSAFVRNNALALFKLIANRHTTRLLALFNYVDGNYTVNIDDGNDFVKRLDDYKYPKIPTGDLSPIEINNLITELAAVADYLYGGYSTLAEIKEDYDGTNKHLVEVAKAILMSTSEWEGESLYNLSMPPEFFSAKIALDSLVKRYNIAMEEGREKYEKLSRMITVMDNSFDASERASAKEAMEAKSYEKPGWKKV